MLYQKLLTGITTGLLLCVQTTFGLWTAEAAEPKSPAKDVLYMLGFYYGNGENILIRQGENGLELLYKYEQEDRSFAKSNRYPMTKVHFDSYLINEAGPMGGSETTVHFDRDPDGYGITCRVGGHVYTRAFLGYTEGEKEKVFTIPAHKPEEWEKMTAEAKAAVMPVKLQQGKVVDLVNANTISGLKVRSIYGNVPNFFGHAIYDNTNLYVGSEVASALERVQARLAPLGYGLVLWDAYRPWHVSKLATAALPANNKDMLENPDKKGSSHNTGIAVDVSLVDLATGEELEMPSAYDEPSFRQYSSYAGGTLKQRYRRAVLRDAMLSEGFKGIEMEWWHFEYGKREEYAHLNIGYEQLPE